MIIVTSNNKYLDDDKVRKNLKEFRNNKEDFIKNSSVLDFDKKNNDVLAEKLENANLNKKNVNRKDDRENSRNREKRDFVGLLLWYFCSMIVLPFVVYFLFEEHFFSVNGPLGLFNNLVVDSIEYRNIIFLVYFVSDIIITFFMVVKFSLAKWARLGIIFFTVFSGVVKFFLIMCISFLSIILDFIDGFFPLGFIIDSFSSLFNLIILVLADGKICLAYFSYGVYVGLGLAFLFDYFIHNNGVK